MLVVSTTASKLAPKVYFSGRHLSTIPTLIDGQTKLPFHRTKVQVCGQLYQQFKERGWKRYKDAPKEGIEAHVEYYDNHHIVGDKTPSNVLLFSGIPSTFAVLKPVIDYYNDNGIRVIYPKFPELSLTKSCKYFRHSPEERAELVKAILPETGVDNFDMVASHSSGHYTAVKLLKDPEGPVIRSSGWLNPCPPEPIVPMQPYWFSKGSAKVYQWPAGRFILEKLFMKTLKAMGNPFVVNNMDTIILGAFALHYAHVYKFVDDLHFLKMKKFPMFLAFSENDKIITRRMNKLLLEHLGVRPDDAALYDKDGSCPDWLQMIRFAAGGHFCYMKYPDIVNKAMGQHLKRIQQMKMNAPKDLFGGKIN